MEVQKGEKRISEISSRGVDYTVSKVKKFYCAINDSEAQRNESVDAACDYAVNN